MLIVNPSIIRLAGFFRGLAGFKEKWETSRSIVMPMYIIIPDPPIVMKEIIRGFFKNLINPNIIQVSMANSIMMWPKIMSGPAFAPRFTLSWITVLSSGPGAKAPEKAIKKEIKNIET